MSNVLSRVGSTLLKTWRQSRGVLGALRSPGQRSRPLARVDDLIIDLGAHRGHDTDFYLQKGFRVVAIEADPYLVEEIRQRFASALASGQLCLLPCGIHEHAGEFTFYKNLDKDDWSSFKPEFGTRDGTRYQVLKVNCIRFEEVLETFGVPHYLKIDIEGHDRYVLQSLLRLRVAPRYLSVESHSLDYLAYLRALGYEAFKIVNQVSVRNVRCPFPAREGRYVDFRFDSLGHSSGLFGEESPGPWQNLEEAAYEFLHVYLGFPERGSLGSGWYDFHARLGEAA